MSDTMALQRAARTALDVQNACNLTGVLHSFLAAAQAVRTESDRLGKGTDWINQHPICFMFADKIGSLVGTQSLDGFSGTLYSKNMKVCEKLARGETVDY